MDVKRIFRGPWLWIVVAVIGVLIALQYLSPNGGYQQINTSAMVGHLKDGSVKSVLFVDGDQQIQATLDNGQKVTADWVSGQQTGLINLPQKGVEAGQIQQYNDKNPQPSLIGSI